jgi:O-antigen ligase
MLAGIVASKSRGGLFTLVIIAAGALIWGFDQWPRRIRWYWRMLTGSILLLSATVAIPLFAGGAIERILAYPPLKAAVHGDLAGIHKAATQTSRYHMYSAAYRAWRDNPVTGIGPGMHPHMWPRYAASPDGDRDTGIWPTFTNTRNYSYKVHSDWLQLLEEYGIIGFIFMLITTGALFIMLQKALTQSTDLKTSPIAFTPPLAALLALAAMVFHSLGDFNLQIPAIGWTLAALIGMGLSRQTEHQFLILCSELEIDKTS